MKAAFLKIEETETQKYIQKMFVETISTKKNDFQNGNFGIRGNTEILKIVADKTIIQKDFSHSR